jgi:hypothetical protein
MVLGGEESELTQGMPPAKPCGSSVGTEPLLILSQILEIGT